MRWVRSNMLEVVLLVIGFADEARQVDVLLVFV